MTNTPSFLDSALRRSVRYDFFFLILYLVLELPDPISKEHPMQLKDGILVFTFMAIWGIVMGFCMTKPIQPNKAFSAQLVLTAVATSALLAMVTSAARTSLDVSDVVILGVFFAVIGGIGAAFGQYSPGWKNRLETLNPELAAEWHPTKNWGITTRDVTPDSGRKAWWKCPNGHEWRATINSRQKGLGCPVCKT